MITGFSKNVYIVPSMTACTATGKIKEFGATGTPSVTNANSSATANNFGNWTQVIASLAKDSYIQSLSIGMLNHSSGFQWCVEIGKGAASSEVTIARFSSEAALVYYDGSVVKFFSSACYNLLVPILVAAGTRLAVRVSDSIASAKNHTISINWLEDVET